MDGISDSMDEFAQTPGRQWRAREKLVMLQSVGSQSQAVTEGLNVNNAVIILAFLNLKSGYTYGLLETNMK